MTEDIHDIWAHRWLTPKAKSYNSPIQGLGVIAIEKINKGEIILVYGGVIVPTSDIEKYHEKVGDVGIQIDNDFFICPTSHKELEKTGVINHSCEPNAGFKNSIELVAIQDIEKGEEITFDYAFSESHLGAMECKCGKLSCRKTITKGDWQIKELQEKYGDYFSPYLKAKFKSGM